MISIFASTIAASSPWLLLGIPCALALLVYVFRVRGTSKQAVVSSLLFLQELPRRPVGRKVFVPPLQFWLELAIFTLLILATAGLFLSRSEKHVAIVVDSSLSMGAIYGSGGTRLEQAKRVATLDASRTTVNTSYSVFSANNALSLIAGPRVPLSEALTALQSISQSYRSDALSQQIQTLLADPTFDSVWVYTDHELTPPASPKLVFNPLPIDITTQTNAWIKEVQRAVGDSSDGVSVTLGYAGTTTREAILDGECYINSGAEIQKWAPKTVTLSPNQHTREIVSPRSTEWSFCRAHIRLQDASLFDSLPLDNEGWITKESAQAPVRVASALTPEQLGLTSSLRLSFVRAGETEETKGPLPTIYHRRSLSAPPTIPSLLVLPPTGPLPWGGKVFDTTSQVREISRWSEAHPLLTYVNPSLISLSEARPLQCPESSTPVLFSALGPLACAGDLNGSRYVIVGFELFPFDGAKNPPVSILTLNILKWLFQEASPSGTSLLPSTLEVPPATSDAMYVRPSESKLSLQGTVLTPQTPGIIKLTSPNAPPTYLALNSFDDNESNLTISRPISLASSSTPLPTQEQRPSKRSLLYWLASLALLVVAADILRRFIKQARWSDA